MNHFVTIKTFLYPHEVAIIRERLEAEEIECFVQDELTIQSNPFYSNAIGGVKLQVRENDVEAAMKILKESEHEEKEATEMISKQNEIKCPACGSVEVSRPRLSPRAFAIGILLLGFPLPFMSKECHCFDCGTDFKHRHG